MQSSSFDSNDGGEEDSLEDSETLMSEYNVQGDTKEEDEEQESGSTNGKGFDNKYNSRPICISTQDKKRKVVVRITMSRKVIMDLLKPLPSGSNK